MSIPPAALRSSVQQQDNPSIDTDTFGDTGLSPDMSAFWELIGAGYASAPDDISADARDYILQFYEDRYGVPAELLGFDALVIPGTRPSPDVAGPPSESGSAGVAAAYGVQLPSVDVPATRPAGDKQDQVDGGPLLTTADPFGDTGLTPDMPAFWEMIGFGYASVAGDFADDVRDYIVEFYEDRYGLPAELLGLGVFVNPETPVPEATGVVDVFASVYSSTSLDWTLA